MARRHDDMTEQEAREELEQRHHPRSHPGRRMESARYGDMAAFGARWGWPLLPLPYAGTGFGPYARPEEYPWSGQYGAYDSAPRGYRPERAPERRDLIDRAGDEIASWFGDEAAASRREADHRGRGPKGYVRSDARIAEDVNDRLTEDPFVDASEVTVTVSEREVTLDGTVQSRSAKRHAEDCAESVTGVAHVQNNLRVALPG